MRERGRFAGKTAVVTGAASGIGKSVAIRLAGEGAHVVVADMNVEAGKQVASEIGGEFVPLNVTDAESWRGLVETTQARDGVDVLVNAAGILRSIDLENDELPVFSQVIDVNVLGTMLGCQAIGPKMRGRDDPAIVNMGSVSSYTGTWNLIAYDVSKGAVKNLTKELAVYYARRGDKIRCNAVHPGVVQTNMVDRFLSEHEEERDAWVETQPDGKFARPEEIANLIVYLASSEARFMTGGDYVVDGGSLI